jgi:hypothetical protein
MDDGDSDAAIKQEVVVGVPTRGLEAVEKIGRRAASNSRNLEGCGLKSKCDWLANSYSDRLSRWKMFLHQSVNQSHEELE